MTSVLYDDMRSPSRDTVIVSQSPSRSRSLSPPGRRSRSPPDRRSRSPPDRRSRSPPDLRRRSRSPTYQPTSPTYQPTSPTYQPTSPTYERHQRPRHNRPPRHPKHNRPFRAQRAPNMVPFRYQRNFQHEPPILSKKLFYITKDSIADTHSFPQFHNDVERMRGELRNVRTKADLANLYGTNMANALTTYHVIVHGALDRIYHEHVNNL